MLFGPVTAGLFGACMLWPHPAGFWGPIATLAIALVLFSFHLIFAGRSLSSFDPWIWIPVIVLLNHFGMPMALHMIGGEGLNGYDGWGIGGPPRVTLAFAVALLCFAALLFGGHLAGIAPMQGRPAPPRSDERPVFGPSMCLLVGGMLMILIGIPIAGLDVLTADYGVVKTAQKFGTADLRLFGSGFLFATAGVYGVFASHTRQRVHYTLFAVSCALLLSVLLILMGDRGGLSAFAIAAGWAFTQRIRPIKRWYVVVGFVFALVVMPVIREYRESRSLVEAQHGSVRDLIASTVYEMGMTLQVFCYTLEHIPKNKNYDWGVGIVSQVLNQIPNLGFSTGAYYGLNPLEHEPSQWLTYTANPIKYEQARGGYAFALGAEWYFNFGIPGVFLGMILTGWLLGWARNASRRSPMMLTFSALLFAMFVVVIRNAVGYPLRTLLWPMIGLLCLRVIWPRSRPIPRLMQDRDMTHRVGPPA